MGEMNNKLLMIYINESHKNLLESFFDEINFYFYTVQKKVESVWSEKLKHKNTNVWPGTDCIFMLSLPEEEVDKMLSCLKTFRVSLPYEIVMSVGVIPMERTIPNLLKDDIIEVDKELLKRLREKNIRK
ncbi:PG0541 family transporter-associated protein [Fusobacterium sp.]|uniref:PG0541 family transporter-associated protein n=1 Tax=Fusobacterium sp. TaxID=68766 RepID=UPI00396C829A